MEGFNNFNVVKNQEEQYSIWPKELDVSQGWVLCGKSGTKEECLAHIKEIWTDMTPLSLR